MAPPRNRRPGFSRRIQFGLFIGYVISIVGIVLAFGLVLASRFDPQGFSQLRGLSIDAGAQVSRIGRAIVIGFNDLEQGVKSYTYAASQNEALRADLATARRDLIESKAIRIENERLKRMLRLVEPQVQPIVTARMIGSGLSTPRRFATLSAGKRQNVRPGQPVRGADGLVGRILETGNHASRVLLITDPDSIVPVRLIRNGMPALVQGRGDGTILVTPLILGGNSFRKGDVVETSGTGGIYPPHIPVAVITRIEGDIAIAWPLAHPEMLDFAVVLRPYLLDAAPKPGGTM